MYLINMKGGVTLKNKLAKFNETLEDYGEYFFSLGSVKKDFDFITNVIKSQGYWSGTSYRFYFDNDFNLLNVEERWC